MDCQTVSTWVASLLGKLNILRIMLLNSQFIGGSLDLGFIRCLQICSARNLCYNVNCLLPQFHQLAICTIMYCIFLVPPPAIFHHHSNHKVIFEKTLMSEILGIAQAFSHNYFHLLLFLPCSTLVFTGLYLNKFPLGVILYIHAF